MFSLTVQGSGLASQCLHFDRVKSHCLHLATAFDDPIWGSMSAIANQVSSYMLVRSDNHILHLAMPFDDPG